MTTYIYIYIHIYTYIYIGFRVNPLNPTASPPYRSTPSIVPFGNHSLLASAAFGLTSTSVRVNLTPPPHLAAGSSP